MKVYSICDSRAKDDHIEHKFIIAHLFNACSQDT